MMELYATDKPFWSGLTNTNGGWVEQRHEADNLEEMHEDFFPKSKTGLKLMMYSDALPKVIKSSITIMDTCLLRDLQALDPVNDALVPEMDPKPLSFGLVGDMTPTLDVLSSLESFGPGGPLGLLGGVFPSPETVNSVLSSGEDSLHNSRDNETFQDLTELLTKDSKASPSRASVITSLPDPFQPLFKMEVEPISPAPLPTVLPKPEFLSPAGIVSARQLANLERFMSSLPDGSTSRKQEDRYSAMRKKNNIASKRSRQTRRERELENEEKAKVLAADNESLRAKVRKLEEMTNMLKMQLIESVKRK